MSGNMTALLNGPAGVPPAGTIPQLDHPPNQRTVTQVLPTLSIVLMSLLVAMRMYTTVFVTRRVGIADCELSTNIGNLFRSLISLCHRFNPFGPCMLVMPIRLGTTDTLQGCFIGFAAMCLVAGKIAPGLHIWDLRLIHLSSYLYVSPKTCLFQWCPQSQQV